MARTSRNNRSAAASLYNMEEKRIATAIYARLSVKDNGEGKEAMQTQVEYLLRFLSGRKDLKLAGIYQDNGRTGTDFARPAFGEMMEAIKRGEIGCVVVKDLSRFGRNYMEAGAYLEQIFPALGVRFLAVDDHYDSKEARWDQELEISVKNICHHAYAKDISAKICTHLDLRKKCGLYLAGTAPYGYRIVCGERKAGNGTGARHLEVVKEQAEIVKRIFAMRLEGIGTAAIARRLNDEGVPAGRAGEKKEGDEADEKDPRLWSASGVRFILENPVYCGCLVERKSKRAYYLGEKERQIPRKEWRLIENTHEAILERESYETVRLLMEQASHRARLAERPGRGRTENLLKGLIRCGYCRYRMQRDSGYYGKDGTPVRHRFLCPQKYKKRGGCSAPSIEEETLLGLLGTLLDHAAYCLGYVPSSPVVRKREEAYTALPKEWYPVLIEEIVVWKGRVKLCLPFSSPWEQNGRKKGAPSSVGSVGVQRSADGCGNG